MDRNDVILSIIEQHAEEAAFLWTQRDHAVLSRNYTVRELARLDERVEAHLDGLRIAGECGWEVCKKTVEAEETGAVFALASLAYESNDPAKVREALAIGCAKPDLERQLISALGWMPFEKAKLVMSPFLNDPDPRVQRVGIAGFAVHREDPGPKLVDAISDPDNRLRGRAILAVAELGRKDLASYIRAPKSQLDEYTQFAAAWALARFGWPDPILKTIAEGGGKYSLRALDIAMRAFDLDTAKAWCRSLLNQPDKVRLGVIGAGIIGDPEFVDTLIQLMHDEKFARIAAESFSLITGADLEKEGLAGKPPKDLSPPPSDDPDLDDVAPDPDENLVWPILESIEKRWEKQRQEIRMRIRHFRGKQIVPESLESCLTGEFHFHRAFAALELAVAEPNQSLFEVRARIQRYQ